MFRVFLQAFSPRKLSGRKACHGRTKGLSLPVVLLVGWEILSLIGLFHPAFFLLQQ